MRQPAVIGSLFLALVLLAGCAADKPKPTPLENYEPKIAGRLIWQERIGAMAYAMVPAVRDNVVQVASAGGEVVALQADSGTVLWRAEAGGPISAGVGSDGRFTSVVTRSNEVVTFDSGRPLWRKRVPSSVVTPPLVAGERVFVMGVDRAVHAFDALDGRKLWTLQRPGDALTLAQASVLTFYRNTLLVAQGPRLAGVDPLRGTVQWEVPMANPRGGNEVERLADLVGPAVRVGERVCMRAFQAAVGCADAARGAVLWSRSVGGANAVAGDAERIFGADASDRITAWRAATGDVVWTSEKLLHRGLSGAVAVGPALVFGDADGWVHFLDAATGEQQLRLPTDGKAVVGTPVLVGTTLLVTTQGGGLFAFRPN
ncbi:MAG: outer membrane protein assembly factor BamB [Rubrivivax sp.]|nr:outer membrane protein assembly factor BamB [Rubrivivax sp.]MDP3223654.1 outer membrane protein assembly factor BamB [Rubrivivax sp.]